MRFVEDLITMVGCVLSDSPAIGCGCFLMLLELAVPIMLIIIAVILAVKL